MAEATAPATPGTGGWKKTAGIVLVTGLAAAGGGFWWSQSATAQATLAGAAPPAPVSRGLVKFDPFVVNLADGAGTRFLRTTLQLVVEPSEGAEAMAADAILMVELRAAILELLAQETAAALVTPDGKTAAKTAIVSRVQDAVPAWKISDVLFSEFVVQF